MERISLSDPAKNISLRFAPAQIVLHEPEGELARVNFFLY